MDEFINEKKATEYKGPRKSYRNAEFVTTVEELKKEHGEKWQIKLETILNDSSFIRKWAYIIHDKDVDEITGKLKSEHIHCALEFNTPMSYSTVANHLKTKVQQIEIIKQKKPYGKGWCADIGGLLSYMTHRNSQGKHQYNDEEIISKNGWDWKSERAKSEQIQQKSSIENIYLGIVDGTIKKSKITDYIDPHIYIKNKREIENAFDYRRKMLANQKNRNVEVIYIYGDSGTGKTSLAKSFADSKKLDCFITGGTNDPIQGYADEEVVIFDDARPDNYLPEDWLKILDNHTNSAIKSRYNNVILQAKYIIITSTINIYDFFKYTNEENKQFRRRCRTLIILDNNNMSISEYNNETNDYKCIKVVENPILKKYKKTIINDNNLLDIASGLGINLKTMEGKHE